MINLSSNLHPADKEALQRSPNLGEWAVLIILFLALRLGGLFFFHPFHSALFPMEEYYRGVMALRFSFYDLNSFLQLRPDEFCGGSIVISPLIALFFRWFGVSAFVMKSVSVLISLGSLMLWFQMIYREISRRCAWRFSLFFIFAPPAFQIYAMVPLGDHYETMFLSALTMKIFMKLYQSPFPERLRGWVFLLGVMGGFGLWFAYIYGLTLGAVVILGFWRKVFKWNFVQWAVFLGGFILGFSPWLWINIHSGFSGLLINDVPILESVQLQVWNPDLFFLRDFLKALGAPAGRLFEGYAFIKWAYTALIFLPLGLWIWCSWTKGKLAEVPKSFLFYYFIIYAVLHSLAVQLTRFEGERYIMPVFPAVFFGCAYAIEALETYLPKLKKYLARVWMVSIIGMGAGVWISMTSLSMSGLLLKTRGYAFDYLTSIPACRYFEPCLTLHQNISGNLQASDQEELWVAFASIAAGEWLDKNEPFPFEQIPEPKFVPAFYFNLGRLMIHKHIGDWSPAAAELQKKYGAESFKYQEVLKGMAHDFVNYPPQKSDSFRSDWMDQTSQTEYFRGLGGQLTFFWRQKDGEISFLYKQAGQYLELQPQIDKTDFFRGMGRYFVQNMYHMPLITSKDYQEVLEIFSPSDAAAFFEGVGMGIEELDLFYPEPYQAWLSMTPQSINHLLAKQAIQTGRQMAYT